MALTIETEVGRTACRESVDCFVRAVDELDELALLGASRCHGWARLDVVTHVLAGWQEMMGGLVSPVDSAPSVDAASYWTAFAADNPTEDPVPVLMAQRRRSGAYSRPSSAVAQLRDVAEALLRGIDSWAAGACQWQGHVFTPGDFLAIWAVEDVVHHLDLLATEPPPASCLSLARQTVSALAGRPLPDAWSDTDAVLIGSGRLPVPGDRPDLADVLPVLG